MMAVTRFWTTSFRVSRFSSSLFSYLLSCSSSYLIFSTIYLNRFSEMFSFSSLSIFGI
jgi:hypothetical protein